MDYSTAHQETMPSAMLPTTTLEDQQQAFSATSPSAGHGDVDSAPMDTVYPTSTTTTVTPPPAFTSSSYPPPQSFLQYASMYVNPQQVGGNMSSGAVYAPPMYSSISPSTMAGMPSVGGGYGTSYGPMYGGAGGSPYSAGGVYPQQPVHLNVPQFVAPNYTSYTLPGGAPVNYLPPVIKKADGKKKKKGFCC